MRIPTERDPLYCADVRWDGEDVERRYRNFGAGECRVESRGVEVHACRLRAGHQEDGLQHVCYCGLTWNEWREDPEEAGEKYAGSGGPSTETAQEGGNLPEGAGMVGKDLWQEAHRRFFVERQGKLQIGLELGIDRKTVRRLLAQQEWRPYTREPRVRTLLSPFTDYLRQRASEVGYSARILFQELRDKEYAGSYETVKRFVKPLRQQGEAEVTVRFETEPGQQSQIDWGQARVLLGGRPTVVHFFVLTLGYSRRSFYAAYLGESLGQLLDAHERAFEYFGGHTREHLYDRMRTVCRPAGDGGVIWNETFREFSRYWGFDPRVCRPYRAKTKGKVESGVRYLKRNFLPGRSFVDLTDLAEQLLQWQRQIADVRIHGTTRERPCDRFLREQPHLVPTAGHAGFRLEARQPRMVAEDYLISFETNRYSVPCRLIGQRVEVQRRGNQLFVFHRNQSVAEHDVLAGKYQVVIRPEHGPGPIARTARRVLSSVGPTITWPPPSFPEVQSRELSIYDALIPATVPA